MDKVQIKAKNNGPYIVEGDFTLVDAKGEQFDLAGRTKIVLCGCGMSKGSPICDGSHNRGDFSWDRSARALPPLPGSSG